MDPNQPPRVFSERYELNHLIARGGMAEVYRAHDRLLDRPVALKVLFPELSVDRSFVERFRREAQAAANLSHPNIVPVFDWGEDSGTYFIVMEFIDGRPLSSILKSAGPLAPERSADVGVHVAAALGYAHKHGVVHRDVKPGNVLITDDGHVKVTDFGIARAINTEESLTQTGAVMGTATYFSPEQAEGIGVDARSDIYSLGVVLFEMVTGRPPFLGESPVAVASKHVRDLPPAPRELNPSIPPTFEAIVMKSMAKNPAHRYATAEELRADLLRFSEGRNVLAMSDTTSMLQTPGATMAMGAIAAGDATGAIAATRSQVPPAADEEPTSNRTATYAIILVLLILLLLGAGYLLGRNLGYFGGSASFNLPPVVGETQAAATSKLRSEGLVVTPQKKTSNQSAGTVLATDPVSGSLVKKGDTVTITVAAQPAASKTTVPHNITNTALSTAKSILANAGLKYTVVYKSSTQQSNTVLTATPAPGDQIAKGGTVGLVVSSGPPDVPVPPLVGLSAYAAGQAVQAVGLVTGPTSTDPSTTIPAGNVISSSPPSGTQVAPGSSVDIVVSSGPPPPTTTTSSTTTTTAPSTPTSTSTSTTTSTTTTNP